ncbi:MAG: hypothetical protein H7138_17190 [Myxococcales bacterium]|nr:hypothetical protein [Myxococcales bacterium]
MQIAPQKGASISSSALRYEAPGRIVPGQGRLGDKASVGLDAHGCPFCPHHAIGPAIQGSPDVHVNLRPALRVGDPGIHAACCGKNIWTASTGSLTVIINGRGAHRIGDETRHCGGIGALVEGSPNVIVGEATVSPADRRHTATASSQQAGRAVDGTSGARSQIHDPADRIEPGVDLDPELLHARAQAETLRRATAAHVAFCEECERAASGEVA